VELFAITILGVSIGGARFALIVVGAVLIGGAVAYCPCAAGDRGASGLRTPARPCGKEERPGRDLVLRGVRRRIHLERAGGPSLTKDRPWGERAGRNSTVVQYA
jgi:hypothetical protein